MSDDHSPMLGGHTPETGREPALTGDRALLHAVEMLSAPDEQTRLDAVFALAELGDERAAGYLVDMLGSNLPADVRDRAALALGRVGLAALPMLLPRISDVENTPGWPLDIALGAICAHFPETRQQVSPLLVGMFHSDEDGVSSRAIWLMGAVRDESCIPNLLEALRIPGSRGDAEEALGQFGAMARRPEVLDALFGVLLGQADGSPGHSSDAAALARIGDPATIPHMLNLMADPHSRLDHLLPQLIGDGMGAEAAPHLVAALADPRCRKYQRDLIRALGLTGSEAAVDCLLELLNPPGGLTGDIVEALGLLKRKRTIPALVLQLKSTYKPSVVAQCLHALSLIDDPSALPELVPFLDQPMVGGAVVIEMLTRFRYEPAIPALIDVLPEPMLRTFAIRALLTIGTEAAYRGLLKGCDQRTLRNARPWVSRDLWVAFYRWRRAAGR